LHSNLLEQELLAFRCSIKTKQIMQILQKIELLFSDLWNTVKGKNNILICTWTVSKYELFVMIGKSPVQLFSMECGPSTHHRRHFYFLQTDISVSLYVQTLGWFLFCPREFWNRQGWMFFSNITSFIFLWPVHLVSTLRSLLEKRLLIWSTDLH